MNNCCDLLVVGGGINGAGIARDAAGRGLSVILVEKDDLAAHTSSASSKLIHGGIRYLEHFHFKLVRESLTERERLVRAAPHIVRPLEFVLPLGPGTRPAWMIRAGLFLYEHLGPRSLLPRSHAIRPDADGRGQRLQPGCAKALVYWDARVQDSRLVVATAIDAAEHGAAILTRTELLEAHPDASRWAVRLRGPEGERSLMASALVNAAGPWVSQLLERIDGAQRPRKMRLVKGSHIVVPRLYTGEHAFVLQNRDRRVVFAIPFESEFTLLGTTDVEWTGPPGVPAISDDEIEYLLETIGHYFAAAPSRGEIAWSYSGIRALVDDGASDPSKVTRDYLLELDAPAGRPPLLSVFGGKITTYRRLAEQAVDRLARWFPAARGAWTQQATLPGGEIPELDLERYSADLVGMHEGLPPELLARFARTYGSRTERLLDGVPELRDLGEHFGAGLYAREVDYLAANEWARTAEDVLFRRTKLGLHLSNEGAARLSAYMGAN